MGVRFSPLLPKWVYKSAEFFDWRCDAGSFNGRTRVFEARYERSIRSPARFGFDLSSRSGEGYGYFFVRKTPYLTVPSSCCEVIQLVRITGSDPVHARSNRALAANFSKWSQRLAEGCLTVYQEGRVQLPLRPPKVLKRAWYSGWCLSLPS